MAKFVEECEAQFIPKKAQITFGVVPKIVEKKADSRQLEWVFRRRVETGIPLKESEQIFIEIRLFAQAFIEKSKLDAAG